MKRAWDIGRWAKASFAVAGLLGALAILAIGYPIWRDRPLPPIIHIDRLANPIRVVGWNERGFKLANDRVVMPTGMTRLPKHSIILEVAIEHGVEIDPDGKTFGLVRICHTCGNDRVKYDLARIDLAQMLAYEREGSSTLKPKHFAEEPFVKAPPGWDISEYWKMNTSYDPSWREVFASGSRMSG